MPRSVAHGFAGFHPLRALTGWLRVVRPQLNAGPTGVLARLTLLAFRYVLFWAIVWVGIWQLLPTVLVSSRAGLGTLFEVLPATLVAILVLILGSVFVIAQGAAATWGTRAPVMISLDSEIAATVLRPLLLLVACVLLSGQVPDSGSPAEAVTAAVAVLALATVRMLLVAAMVFPAIVQRYTVPRGFPQFVVEDLEREFRGGQLGLVVFRGGMLGEMLRMALRRGDSVATRATLEAIVDFQTAYLRARARQPTIREYVTDGFRRSGWLAEDLVDALVRAGEEGLRLGGAPDDVNTIASVLATLADNFDAAEDGGDAITAIDGLTALSTSHTQVTESTTNVYSEPVGQLAWLEAQAEDRNSARTAARALAGWALGASYARYHLGFEQHPLQPRSIRTFGQQPPWRDALALIMDHEWQRQWANKLPGQLVPIVEEVLLAAKEHAEHHGIEPPDLALADGHRPPRPARPRWPLRPWRR